MIHINIKRFYNKTIKYIKNVLIAIDQLANTLIGGYPDESISSRAYRTELQKGIDIYRKIIDTILFFDDNHCQESYNSEQQRKQFPPGLRQEMDKTENSNE